MKEIKFRAWDKDNSKMVDVVSYEKNYETKEGHYDLAWRNAYENENFLTYGMKIGEECEVMQYVGLKDKHAKEIYEGDIESDENGNLSVVCYLKKYGAYCFVPLELYVHEDYENQVAYSHGYDCYFHNAIPSKYATIIGNIYENPELLGDSQ